MSEELEKTSVCVCVLKVFTYVQVINLCLCFRGVCLSLGCNMEIVDASIQGSAAPPRRDPTAHFLTVIHVLVSICPHPVIFFPSKKCQTQNVLLVFAVYDGE